jgi:hypothetical protein
VLLDETLDLGKGGAGGVSRRVRLREPAVVDVAIDPQWTSGPLRFSFGPPRPVDSGPPDLPDPAMPATVSWTADAGTRRTRFPALAPGMYVLHVVPERPLASGRVWVTVRTLPPDEPVAPAPAPAR